MASEVLAAAAPPAVRSPSISASTSTITSLSEDELLEIFLRLPNLPAFVRAALTCRSWLRAVRSSPSFRRLFRALHPAPLIGLFLESGTSVPAFTPVRRSAPDVTAALRRGDFFLTSLPQKDDSTTSWDVTDCRDGYILLWNYLDWSLAALNPMTWGVDIFPMPPDSIAAESGRGFAFLGFYLLSTDENPSSFRVVCVCADYCRVRAAIFSSETWDWVIHPWVHIGGDCSLKFQAGSLVDDSVYWPFHGEGRMVRINTATMDISVVDLPEQVEVQGRNFKAGETKNGELCIVYASSFLLHVWIRSVDGDGIAGWVLQKILSLSDDIDRITRGLQGHHHDLNIVQVRDGYVYLSTTQMFPAGLSLSLETMRIELLTEGRLDSCAHLYFMAWPPSLIGDIGSIG